MPSFSRFRLCLAEIHVPEVGGVRGLLLHRRTAPPFMEHDGSDVTMPKSS